MLLIGILQGVKLILLPVPINSIFEKGSLSRVLGGGYDQMGRISEFLKRLSSFKELDQRERMVNLLAMHQS